MWMRECGYLMNKNMKEDKRYCIKKPEFLTGITGILWNKYYEYCSGMNRLAVPLGDGAAGTYLSPWVMNNGFQWNSKPDAGMEVLSLPDWLMVYCDTYAVGDSVRYSPPGGEWVYGIYECQVRDGRHVVSVGGVSMLVSNVEHVMMREVSYGDACKMCGVALGVPAETIRIQSK